MCMKEGSLFDRKSLKTIIGKRADFNELAKDCVAFANAKGTRYFVSPKLIANSKSNVKTSLKTIEPYRLRALILEDLRFHPDSLWSEISERLPDVKVDELQTLIRRMALDGEVLASGGRKFRRYRLP